MAIPISRYKESVTEVKAFMRRDLASLEQAVNGYISDHLYGTERLMLTVDGVPLLWVSVDSLGREHLAATVLAVVRRADA